MGDKTLIFTMYINNVKATDFTYTPSADGSTYTLQYTITTVDTHSIVVYLGADSSEAQVIGGFRTTKTGSEVFPATINVVPGKSAAGTSYIDSASLVGIVNGEMIAGTGVSGFIVAIDGFNNIQAYSSIYPMDAFTVVARHSVSQTATTLTIAGPGTNSAGKYAFTGVLTLAGDYVLEATISFFTSSTGVTVTSPLGGRNNPTFTVVAAAVFPQLAQVVGSGRTTTGIEVIEAGSLVSFSIRAKDRFNNDIPGSLLACNATMAPFVNHNNTVITAALSSIEVTIASGHVRTYRTEDAFLITAVGVDPDNTMDFNGVPFDFLYQCGPAELLSSLPVEVRSAFFTDAARTQGIVSVPAGRLPVGEYNIEVIASKNPVLGPRQLVTISVTLMISADPIVPIMVTAVPLASAFIPEVTLDTECMPVDSAADSGTLNYVWSVVSTHTSTIADLNPQVNSCNGKLRIPAGNLLAGRVYDFECSATAETGGATGYTVSRITTVLRPSGGSVAVTPLKGMELTTIEVAATDWTSPVGNPLTYEFRAIDASNTQQLLSVTSSVNKANVVLAQGAYSVIVCVSDVTGLFSTSLEVALPVGMQAQATASWRSPSSCSPRPASAARSSSRRTSSSTSCRPSPPSSWSTTRARPSPPPPCTGATTEVKTLECAPTPPPPTPWPSLSSRT